MQNNGNNNINSYFVDIYEQAVTDSLLIFGYHIAGIISLHLKEKYSIARLGETAYNPKVLSDALEALLDGSAKIVQRRILRLLYRRIGIEQPFAITINFEERILKARNAFEKKCVIKPNFKKE